MSKMLDAVERGRPAMQYIQELQVKLEDCRAELKKPVRRFRLLSFAAGFVAGALVVFLVLFFFVR